MAKVSNMHEIDRRVARDVMGWIEGSADLWTGDEGGLRQTGLIPPGAILRPWRPSSDANDALEVAWGEHITLERVGAEESMWLASTRSGTSVRHQSACLAICLCALQVDRG